MKNSDDLMADVVFEGGGVKGIGLVGAVSIADERGYQWVNIAGTSAGAIVAALLAAGYSAAEMKQTMKELDYNSFRDASPLDRVPIAWRWWLYHQQRMSSLENRPVPIQSMGFDVPKDTESCCHSRAGVGRIILGQEHFPQR